jgi:hypothetical protein
MLTVNGVRNEASKQRETRREAGVRNLDLQQHSEGLFRSSETKPSSVKDGSPRTIGSELRKGYP